jgi:hypothetical protein
MSVTEHCTEVEHEEEESEEECERFRDDKRAPTMRLWRVGCP